MRRRPGGVGSGHPRGAVWRRALPWLALSLLVLLTPELLPAQELAPASELEGAERTLAAWLSGLGWPAYLLAVLLMVTVAILPIPAEIPAMANGAVFGPLLGSLVTWVGAVVGALISYELAWRYGRPLVQRFVAPSRIEQADSLARKAGAGGMIALRLVPVVAFTALNWVSGLCQFPRRTFVWTTAVGIVPGTVAMTGAGYGLAELYDRHPTIAIALIVAVTALLGVWAWRRRGSVAPDPSP